MAIIAHVNHRKFEYLIDDNDYVALPRITYIVIAIDH